MRIFRFFPLLFLLVFASCSHTGKYMAPVKTDGKYGYINEYGDVIIKPKFEDAWSFIRGCAIVKDSGKYGMIDKTGAYILKPQFDSIIPFSSSTIIVKKNGVFGFIENGTGKELIAPQFESVFYYTEHLCIVQKGRGLGIVNNLGKIVCPVVMQDFKDMMGPAAKCIQQDTTDENAMIMAILSGHAGKMGLVNRKGEVMLAVKYDEIFDDLPSGYYYPYLRDEAAPCDTTFDPDAETQPLAPGKYGIVDTTGKIISEPVFEDIPVYGDGMFRVKKNGKYGFTDLNGKIVIEPQFDFVTAFSEGKTIALNGTTASIIDKTGKVLVKDLGKGAGLYKFNSGLARCRDISSGDYGFINAEGGRVINPAFDVADDFESGRAIVSVGGKYGLIDTKGNFVVKPEYEFFFDLGNGYYQTKNKEGKVGVVDSTGKQLLPEVFDEVFHFQPAFFAVDSAGFSGAYRVNGQLLFPCVSTRPVYFFSGKCVVNQNGRSGMIDTTGKRILALEYDSIGVFFKGYATIQKGKLYGAIDSTGKVVIEPKFEELRPIVNGFAVYGSGNKYGYVDVNGNVVIEAKYEDVSVLVDPDRKEFE